MLKPQDLLIALKLASISGEEPVTFASLATSLSMSASEVFAAAKRAVVCHLMVDQSENSSVAGRYRPISINLREFLLHGLRYVFPAEPGQVARGFRTAQDALPLNLRIVRPVSELPLVWPHPDGDTRGLVIKPLFSSAPDAARRDPRLFEWLALVDALRVGDARVRSLAALEVEKLIGELSHDRFR